MTGKIKSVVYDRGYGFIAMGPGKPDIYFHVSALLDKGRFAHLVTGQELTFDVDMHYSRGPRALRVGIVENLAAPVPVPPAS